MATNILDPIPADELPAVPVPIEPLFDFSDWQATHPTAPLPADRIDAEFEHTDDTINNIIARLALIQRDDGGLMNGSVFLETLDPEVLAALGESEDAAAASAAAAAASAANAAASEAAAEVAATDAEASQASAAASEANAAASAAAADASADAAAASAADAAATAAVMPPLPSAGDANKALILNPAGTAYVFKTVILQAVDGIFDTLGIRLRGADAVAPTDLVTLQQAQGLITGSGAVPPPLAGDVGKFLGATATGVFNWVVLTVAALSDATAYMKGLLTTVNNAAGLLAAAGAAPAAQGVPIPANPGDDGKSLKALAGAFSWQTQQQLVPIPANPGDTGKALLAAAGAYGWTAILQVPAPVAGDVSKALTATGAGAYAWVAIPAAAAPPDATAAVKGIVELATIPEFEAGADQTRPIVPYVFANSKFNSLGKQVYLLGAGALAIHPTNGPTGSIAGLANGQLYRVLAFADAVTQSAGLAIPLPKKVDVTQPFNVRLRFSASQLGNVLWRMGYSTSGDGEAMNVVMTTVDTVTANGVANTVEVTAQIVCAWPAGTVKEDTLYLTVVRVGGDATDTLAGIAYLHNVEVAFIVDKANDA